MFVQIYTPTLCVYDVYTNHSYKGDYPPEHLTSYSTLLCLFSNLAPGHG